MLVEAPKKGAAQDQQEVARISAAENEEVLGQMGLPPDIARVAPGAAWLIQHGKAIVGHINLKTGDIVIDIAKPTKPL